MPKKRILLVGILLVFCAAGQWLLQAPQANAQSPDSSLKNLTDPEKSQDDTDPDDLRQKLVRQLILMIVIVALFGVGLWWFAKRYSRGLMGGRGKLVTVAETLPLGPRKMVHVLEVGPRKLLLGSTADSIRFLADITEALPMSSDFGQPEKGDIE